MIVAAAHLMPQVTLAFIITPSSHVLARTGITALANAIPDMEALTSLHVGQNGIPEKQMGEIIAIAMGMDSVKILCEVPFKDKTLSDVDVSRKNLGTEGALVIAEYLDGNEALTQLGISDNDIRAEGGKALAEALRGNKVITELNIASNNLGRHANWNFEMSGVANLADVIPGMRALIKLDISSNNLGGEQEGELQRICVASGIELAK
jgi:Ran GTPase-activating protein (RanGAP) involved in mRNA processing and transport